MLGFARQIVRDHRRSLPFKALAACSEKFLRAWYNEGFYVFDRNGESFAIQTFAEWNGGKPASVWDIGAHDGEWAREVHKILPSASVTSFEILKVIADRIPVAEWLTVENLGVSDHDGTVEVMWNKSHDTTNSITPRSSNKWFSGSDTVTINCEVTTMDSYAARTAAPTLIKIDTEGHEASVFAGGKALLSGQDAPVMIQFEYGDTWLTSASTLRDVQSTLESYGYSVGRLYPDHVEFKDYDFSDDHFRMGNMIAVKDSRLKSMLAG